MRPWANNAFAHYRRADGLKRFADFRRALQLTARQVLTSGASETVPDESEFGRQLVSFLERNEEALLDPVSLYERIRLGVTRTIPLLGTLPGHEEGAGFILFRKAAVFSAGTVTAGSIAPVTGTADLMVKTVEPGAEILVDGNVRGQSPLPSAMPFASPSAFPSAMPSLRASAMLVALSIWPLWRAS